MNDIQFIIPGMAVPYKKLSRDDNYLKVLPQNKVGTALQDQWIKLQAYIQWKDKVREISEQFDFDRRASKQVFLHINFYFTSKKHSDIYSYWLNIADSIFDRKKYVTGSFNVFYAENKAQTEVIISCVGNQLESKDVNYRLAIIKDMSIEEAKDLAL